MCVYEKKIGNKNGLFNKAYSSEIVLYKKICLCFQIRHFLMIKARRKWVGIKGKCDYICINRLSVKRFHALTTFRSFPLFIEPKVSPTTFCKVFPFHLMFDKDLKIVQTGSTVARVIPKVTLADCRITDILDTVRPHLELTFENILSHINTIYVLKTRPGVMQVNAPSEYRYLRLKGQMLYVPETDLVIFLCYPSVMNLDDLTR